MPLRYWIIEWCLIKVSFLFLEHFSEGYMFLGIKNFLKFLIPRNIKLMDEVDFQMSEILNRNDILHHTELIFN